MSKRTEAMKAKRAARRKTPPARYPITPSQAKWLIALSRCSFAPASYDKRFVRDLQSASELTERQGQELARLAHRYRRQLRLTDDQASALRAALLLDSQHPPAPAPDSSNRGPAPEETP